MSRKKAPINHGDYETRLRKAYERLGTDTPKCVFCEVADPFILELHHVSGRKFGNDLVIVCLNHHGRLSSAQKDHPSKLDGACDPLEAMGHFLLGLAELLVLAVEKLKEFGQALIERAQSNALEGGAS